MFQRREWRLPGPSRKGRGMGEPPESSQGLSLTVLGARGSPLLGQTCVVTSVFCAGRSIKEQSQG